MYLILFRWLCIRQPCVYSLISATFSPCSRLWIESFRMKQLSWRWMSGIECRRRSTLWHTWGRLWQVEELLQWPRLPSVGVITVFIRGRFSPGTSRRVKIIRWKAVSLILWLPLGCNRVGVHAGKDHRQWLVSGRRNGQCFRVLGAVWCLLCNYYTLVMTSTIMRMVVRRVAELDSSMPIYTEDKSIKTVGYTEDWKILMKLLRLDQNRSIPYT